jgi:Ca2+-binding EF-hand superfamily protein
LRFARGNADTRAKRNAELRTRLEGMRTEVGGQINELISNMMGVNPEDVLSDEEINQHLTQAFQKFDEDNSGHLGGWEFAQAWMYLGLKGSEEEVSQAFKSVDNDGSGMISLSEFITAIKNSRLVELSLNKVLQKMGVNIMNTQGQYEKFRAATQRRRLLKAKYEENVTTVTKDIIDKLSKIVKVDVPQKNEEDEKLYKTLRDTFDAFDKDGSGEMQFPEYQESWQFLNRPGSPAEIKEVFDSIDVDGTGLIEWNEYVFSLMGERAAAFGALADLETLNQLLDEASTLLNSIKSDLEEVEMSNGERAERNAELRERLEGMKGEMNEKFGNVFTKMMGIVGKDPRDFLTDDQINKLLFETFKKFDTDSSGELEMPEFVKAWEFLGLKGDEAEIVRAFGEVDTNRSGKIDKFEFTKAIKENRAQELSLTVLMSQMDGQLEGMEEFLGSVLFNCFGEFKFVNLATSVSINFSECTNNFSFISLQS